MTFRLLPEPKIPEGPDYDIKQYQHYIYVEGEILQLYTAQRQMLEPIRGSREGSGGPDPPGKSQSYRVA